MQRQELVAVGGSTLFANVVTLGGSNWLPASSTTYTDSSTIAARTYEYRVAAVQDTAALYQPFANGFANVLGMASPGPDRLLQVDGGVNPG